jgi:hypothetical protein
MNAHLKKIITLLCMEKITVLIRIVPVKLTMSACH